MTALRRIAGVFVALLLPAAALGLGLAHAEVVLAPGLDLLPQRTAGFAQVSSIELAPDVVAASAPFDYEMSAYAHTSGARVWAYVARYAGRGDATAHAPELCYPAQGWDISSAVPVTVRLAAGGEIRAQMFGATRGSERELVLWWFQPAGRWPRSALAEHWLRVIDAVSGRPQYAFVRFSTPMTDQGDAPRAQHGERQEMLLELAGAVADRVRSTLAAVPDQRAAR